MTKYNADNERIKREYVGYLRGAIGLSEQSIDTVVKAMHRFEASTNFRSFSKFHIE